MWLGCVYVFSRRQFAGLLVPFGEDTGPPMKPLVWYFKLTFLENSPLCVAGHVCSHREFVLLVQRGAHAKENDWQTQNLVDREGTSVSNFGTSGQATVVSLHIG